jgi:hypothetical protein
VCKNCHRVLVHLVYFILYFFLLFETGSLYVAQAGLELLGSSDSLPSASLVAGAIGANYFHHIQLCYRVFRTIVFCGNP